MFVRNHRCNIVFGLVHFTTRLWLQRQVQKSIWCYGRALTEARGNRVGISAAEKRVFWFKYRVFIWIHISWSRKYIVHFHNDATLNMLWKLMFGNDILELKKIEIKIMDFRFPLLFHMRKCNEKSMAIKNFQIG